MKYDDYCARIYDDRRMPAGTRELALAMIWVMLRDPFYRRRRGTNSDGKLLWSRVDEILQRPGPDGGGVCRVLLREDAPRYHAPQETVSGRCVVSKARSAGNCGQAGYRRVVEFDSVTGWVSRVWWYCKRHAEVADQMAGQVGTPKRPVPIPNKGGLLPCYFAGDWVELYAQVSPSWRPPYHGVIADEWPVPGDDVVPRPPRLLVLPGGAGHPVS